MTLPHVDTLSSKLCSDGVTPLLENEACPRCGLSDWQSYPEKLDIRCGGCGLWYVTRMLEELGIQEAT